MSFYLCVFHLNVLKNVNNSSTQELQKISTKVKTVWPVLNTGPVTDIIADVEQKKYLLIKAQNPLKH